jgi:hypothetical protein
MNYTTGFSHREIEDLCAFAVEVQSSIPAIDRQECPPILGLGNSVVITGDRQRPGSRNRDVLSRPGAVTPTMLLLIFRSRWARVQRDLRI